MKKIILATVAGIMLSGTAIAACTTKEDITAMDVMASSGHINKGQLSERDKCWYDVYADKNHGVDGKLFWIKVGNQYFAKDLVTIAYKPNRDAWQEAIKADIKDSYLAIHELGNELEAKAGIIKAVAEVVTPVQLEVMKTDLTEVKDELVVALGAVNINANPPLSQEDLELNAYNDGFVAGAEATNIALQSYLENVDLYRDMARGYIKNIMKAEQSAAYKGGNGQNDNPGSDTHAIVDDGNVDIYNSSNTVINNPIDVSGIDLTNVEWDKIEAAVSDAFDQGYNQGYNDGYADGFNDGFKAGVDSVK